MSAEHRDEPFTPPTGVKRRSVLVGAGITATLAGGMIFGAPLLKQITAGREGCSSLEIKSTPRIWRR
jgi:hypothetical protein